MRKLLIRSISGIILVAVVSGALILGETTALALMLLIFGVSFFEFRRMFKVIDFNLFGILLSLGLILIVLFHFYLKEAIGYSFLVLYGVAAVSTLILYSLFAKKTTFRDIGLMTLAMIWIAGSSVFVLSTGWILVKGEYNAELPLILLSFIWINDAGAYLAGSLVGKRKFSPAISPGKTWEGFISGVILTAVAGWLVFLLRGSYTAAFWIVSSILISLSAVAGDLFESKLKREAGVKDSGNIIPGHGGLLDRFDSLLFSAPVFVGILILWELL